MKRARHVITEIQRTRDAADALKKKDFVKVMVHRMVCSVSTTSALGGK